MKKQQGYTDKIPVHPAQLSFTVKDGIVTLAVQNNGVFHRLAQWMLHKPNVSYIRLDATGSFVWRCIDGEQTVFAIGEQLRARFGDACEPLYERLTSFFSILDSYGFVEWKR